MSDNLHWLLIFEGTLAVNTFLFSRSGDVYEGEWYQNKRHGNGTMYWHSTNELYSGQWEFGFQHGHGKHVWMVDTNDDTQVTC